MNITNHKECVVKFKIVLLLIIFISTPLATHVIAPPIVEKVSLKKSSGIYSWVDNKGVTHYTDKFSQEHNAQIVNVDTRGTRYGSKESFRRERQAANGISDSSVNKRSYVASYDHKKNRSDSHNCLKLTRRVSELQKRMRQGYSPEQSNYYQRKKRILTEQKRDACQASL